MDTSSDAIALTHVIDLARVNMVNIAAIGLSLTGVEQWIRLLGMIVALIYTTAKTVQLIKEMMDKSSAQKQSKETKQ
jgi:hypothetical protein